jgi:hypothetical protein
MLFKRNKKIMKIKHLLPFVLFLLFIPLFSNAQTNETITIGGVELQTTGNTITSNSLGTRGNFVQIVDPAGNNRQNLYIQYDRNGDQTVYYPYVNKVETTGSGRNTRYNIVSQSHVSSLDDESFVETAGARNARITAQLQEEDNSFEIKCNPLKSEFVACAVAGLTYNFILTPASWILSLSGKVFDMAIKFTIVNMKGILNLDQSENTINDAWKIVRDLVNIMFIFVLLYVSIKTIVQGSADTAKMVSKIIVVAVLINFSMFFTKFFIDITNTAALSFYGSITESSNSTSVDGVTRKMTIAETFSNQVRLQNLYGNVKNNIQQKRVNYTLVVLHAMGGAIVLFILSLILFVAAIMLVSRFVILTILLITSSLAIGSFILPSLQKNIGDKWVKSLVGNALFAPAFLFMIYVSLRMLNGINILGPTNNAWSNLKDGGPELLINFAITIGLIVASLTVSKQIANSGGSHANNITKYMGNKAVGGAARLGRLTGGAGARAISNRISGDTVAGRFAKRGLNRVAGASFDIRSTKIGKKADLGDASGKGGYDKMRSNADKKREATYKMVGENTTQEKRQMDQYYKLSEKYSQNETMKELLRLEKAKANTEKQKDKELDPEKIKDLDAAVQSMEQKIKNQKVKVYQEVERNHGDAAAKTFEQAVENFTKASKAGKARQENYTKQADEGTSIKRIKLPPLTRSHMRFAQTQRAKKNKKKSDQDKMIEALGRIEKKTGSDSDK